MIGWLRLGGGIAGLLLAVALAWLVRDRFAQKTKADAADRCAFAAERATVPLTDCLAPVTRRVEAARQAQVCEDALLPSIRPESRFRVLNSCGAGVKRLLAERDVAQGERDRLVRELSQASARSVAAVARAEVRAARVAERSDHARTAIAAAPRDAAGHIACDAGCLRSLAD